MPADIIIQGGDDGGVVLGEHIVTKTLGGDPSTARERMIAALEHLGYQIVADEPVVARREAAAGDWFANTVLDHARTVTLRIKPVGSGAVSVTLRYVGHQLASRRAREIITREARAIIALASPHLTAPVCTACLGDTRGDSRYCHNCGAPAGRRPAELDVMRISDNAHQASVQFTLAASFAALALVVFAAALIAKGFTAFTPAAVFAGIFLIPAVAGTLLGMRHLGRALAPPADETASLPGGSAHDAAAPRPLASRTTGPLTPLPEARTESLASTTPASVTEHTTALLNRRSDTPRTDE